mmetsp:Transcript_58550/g.188139  ORF Transcript_58550/g.188139 Transcript_58550/m.188139 type:complete len:210 (+) Transcript_58550:349-978(+)
MVQLDHHARLQRLFGLCSRPRRLLVLEQRWCGAAIRRLVLWQHRVVLVPVVSGLVGRQRDGQDGVIELGVQVPLRYVRGHKLQDGHVHGRAPDGLQGRLGVSDGIRRALAQPVADVLEVLRHLWPATAGLRDDAQLLCLARRLLGAVAHQLLEGCCANPGRHELPAEIRRESLKVEHDRHRGGDGVEGAAQGDAMPRHLALHEAQHVHR